LLEINFAGEVYSVILRVYLASNFNFWSIIATPKIDGEKTNPIITNAIVTAYCCCSLCCGPKAAGIAANGKPPVEGLTIAGPRSIPLGTRVYIETIGWRTVTDRTAKRFDGRFDIYFRNHADAVKFGKRKLKVEHQRN
jgi:3D (Asp-Asp-Asp) domain-containing protein